MGHHSKPGGCFGSLHVSGRVNVDAHEVQRTRDDLEILRTKLRRVTAGGGEISVGVLSFLNHCHVGSVEFSRGAASSLDVLRSLDHRYTDVHVLSQADLCIFSSLRPNSLSSESVSEYRVMSCLVEAIWRQLHARRMNAGAVTQLDERTKLVDGKEVLHAIREMFSRIAGVIAKRFRRVARLPTATIVLQWLRQIPVIQSGKGLDSVGQKFINESIVEIKTFGVRCARTLREDARPGDRKAVRLHAQRLHELHIFLVPVIVIICDVAGSVVDCRSRRLGKSVPDRRTTSIFIYRTFNLIGSGRRPPQETFGKLATGRSRLSTFSLSRRQQASTDNMRRGGRNDRS